MIIHSTFHDYYDTASSYGIDKTIHYVCTTGKIPLQDLEKVLKLPPSAVIPEYHGVKTKGLSDYLTQGYIGFCGFLYPVIAVAGWCLSELNSSCTVSRYYDDRSEFFYTYETFAKFMENGKDLSKLHYWGDRVSPKEWFEAGPYKNDELFIGLKRPVLSIDSEPRHRHGKFVLTNPNLSSFQFYKVKDPVTAFQEIQMYLTNQLVQQKEIIEIEDKYKITGHGYDPKISFRHPTRLKKL